MKDKNKHILDNLKIKTTGFDLPENYFSKFESNFKKNSNKLPDGFISPDNYFEEFEDRFFDNKDHLFTKNSGFVTPKNYFSDLEDKMYTKIETSKVISLKNYRNFKIISFSIAASILLFFSVYHFNTNANKGLIDNVEVAEIENWLDEEFISFSTYEISEIFTENDLDLATNESDEILEYLEDMDIEHLILEN